MDNLYYSSDLRYNKFPCEIKNEREFNSFNNYTFDWTKPTYITPLKMKVKKLNNSLPDLKPAHVGEWIDLYCAEDTTLQKGEFKLIHLGICIELPSGYEAIVAPRSSTAKKFGIIQANSIGIIDNAYCGDNDEWLFPAIAIRDTELKTGDRICQFRLQFTQPNCEIEYVETLNNTDRGGIGSTGSKELRS